MPGAAEWPTLLDGQHGGEIRWKAPRGATVVAVGCEGVLVISGEDEVDAPRECIEYREGVANGVPLRRVAYKIGGGYDELRCAPCPPAIGRRLLNDVNPAGVTAREAAGLNEAEEMRRVGDTEKGGNLVALICARRKVCRRVRPAGYVHEVAAHTC